MRTKSSFSNPIRFVFVLLLLSATISLATKHLRGNADEEAKSPLLFVQTIRITVFERLVRKEGTVANAEDVVVVAIPIVDGIESGDVYAIDLPHEIRTEYSSLIKAGSLILSVTHAVVTSGHTMLLTKESSIQVLHETSDQLKQWRQLNRSDRSGTVRTLAVVRVSTSAGPPSLRQVGYSVSAMEEHLFGNGVSLAHQMNQCSGGSIKIRSAGIYEVIIPGEASDYESPSAMRNVALEQIGRDYGISSASELADHVLVVLPPNHFPDFVGNAGVNHWLMTVNNLWSLDVMVYMHEMGHNLGLGHAYLTDQSADYSSYMSATGAHPNISGPLKCYNAASNRQLGWFKNGGRTHKISFGNTRNSTTHVYQRVTLVALGEADKDTSLPVLLAVGPFTMQYNYASGYNQGTEILQNQVTVAHGTMDTDSGEIPPGQTTWVEKQGLLPGGEVFVVDNFESTGHTLRVEACQAISENKENKANAMVVAVSLRVDKNDKDDMSFSPCNITTREIPDPKASSPTTTITTTPPPTCPDTSSLRVPIIWVGRHRRIRIRNMPCRWIDESSSIRQQKYFCSRRTIAYGRTEEGRRFRRVQDLCQQECSVVTHTCARQP